MAFLVDEIEGFTILRFETMDSLMAFSVEANALAAVMKEDDDVDIKPSKRRNQNSKHNKSRSRNPGPVSVKKEKKDTSTHSSLCESMLKEEDREEEAENHVEDDEEDDFLRRHSRLRHSVSAPKSAMLSVLVSGRRESEEGHLTDDETPPAPSLRSHHSSPDKKDRSANSGDTNPPFLDGPELEVDVHHHHRDHSFSGKDSSPTRHSRDSTSPTKTGTPCSTTPKKDKWKRSRGNSRPPDMLPGETPGVDNNHSPATVPHKEDFNFSHNRKQQRKSKMVAQAELAGGGGGGGRQQHSHLASTLNAVIDSVLQSGSKPEEGHVNGGTEDKPPSSPAMQPEAISDKSLCLPCTSPATDASSMSDNRVLHSVRHISTISTTSSTSDENHNVAASLPGAHIAPEETVASTNAIPLSINALVKSSVIPSPVKSQPVTTSSSSSSSSSELSFQVATTVFQSFPPQSSCTSSATTSTSLSSASSLPTTNANGISSKVTYSMTPQQQPARVNNTSSSYDALLDPKLNPFLNFTTAKSTPSKFPTLNGIHHHTHSTTNGLHVSRDAANMFLNGMQQHPSALASHLHLPQEAQQHRPVSSNSLFSSFPTISHSHSYSTSSLLPPQLISSMSRTPTISSSTSSQMWPSPGSISRSSSTISTSSGPVPLMGSVHHQQQLLQHLSTGLSQLSATEIRLVISTWQEYLMTLLMAARSGNETAKVEFEQRYLQWQLICSALSSISPSLATGAAASTSSNAVSVASALSHTTNGGIVHNKVASQTAPSTPLTDSETHGKKSSIFTAQQRVDMTPVYEQKHVQQGNFSGKLVDTNSLANVYTPALLNKVAEVPPARAKRPGKWCAIHGKIAFHIHRYLTQMATRAALLQQQQQQQSSTQQRYVPPPWPIPPTLSTPMNHSRSGTSTDLTFRLPLSKVEPPSAIPSVLRGTSATTATSLVSPMHSSEPATNPALPWSSSQLCAAAAAAVAAAAATGSSHPAMTPHAFMSSASIPPAVKKARLEEMSPAAMVAAATAAANLTPDHLRQLLTFASASGLLQRPS